MNWYGVNFRKRIQLIYKVAEGVIRLVPLSKRQINIINFLSNRNMHITEHIENIKW